MTQTNPEPNHSKKPQLPDAEHPNPLARHSAGRGGKLFREVAAFVVVLGLGVLAAWGINQLSNNEDSENNNIVAELPTYATPNNPAEQNGSTEILDDEAITNNNQVNQGDASPYSTPEADTPNSAPETYQNSILGFSMTLPVGWKTASESTIREIIFYDSLHSGVISSVEIFDNTSGDTLESLLEQLSRTPNLGSLQRINLDGQEWISFSSSAGTFNRGMVTIRNDRIYYFNGELSQPEFADKFKFL